MAAIAARQETQHARLRNDRAGKQNPDAVILFPAAIDARHSGYLIAPSPLRLLSPFAPKEVPLGGKGKVGMGMGFDVLADPAISERPVLVALKASWTMLMSDELSIVKAVFSFSCV